ncbi:MAG: polymer-forming cytoskeletal protein [Candidatus Aminicenantales bacterium]
MREELSKNKEKRIQNSGKESSLNVSRLGPSFFFSGKISGDEDLVIDGSFKGKIDLKNHNLLLKQSGKIEADIHARNVTILGQMKGNINASGKVFISKEAQMTGDISAFRISIAEGAQFKGSIKMSTSIPQPHALSYTGRHVPEKKE